MYMCSWDIAEAYDRFHGKYKTLSAAIDYLQKYHDLVQSNSDGWAYWHAGTKCANTLCEIIETARRNRFDDDFTPPTEKQVRAACAKIARFMKTNKYWLEYGVQAPELPFE